MTDKPFCAGCRFFDFRSSMGFSSGRCQHPRATKFDRIGGSYYPEIVGTRVFITECGVAERDETIAECDANGWFEKKPKPWWWF